MQRRVGWVLAIVAVLALLFWLFHGSSAGPASSSHAERHRAAAVASQKTSRVDPRSLARAAIRGTVRDGAGAPIANARVCAAVSSWSLPSALTDLSRRSSTTSCSRRAARGSAASTTRQASPCATSISRSRRWAA